MSNNLSIMIPNRGMPAIVPLEASANSAPRHPALAEIFDWTKTYLCKAHQELGRAGPVCPFVPKSLKKQLLFASVYEGEHYSLDEVKEILLHEMERFVAQEPVSGNDAQYKSLLVLFPDLLDTSTVELIDHAQAQLQQYFVPNGLMVGEFHPAPPQKGGLWNREFLPLYSPVPMLVIRHMVPTDLLFLKDSPLLFHGFVRIFGHQVPERFLPDFNQAAKQFGISPELHPQLHPETAMGAPRVMAALTAQKIDYMVHCHDDYDEVIRHPADFARALNYPVTRITKTLFLKSQGKDKYYLLVCAVDQRVDLTALASQLNLPRFELASLAELQQYIKYPPTSVTVIGVNNVPVYVDQALLHHSTILTGSGVPRVEVELLASDLVALCNAKLVTLA